jgi:hypothetical protein
LNGIRSNTDSTTQLTVVTVGDFISKKLGNPQPLAFERN